jgi:cyanate permease
MTRIGAGRFILCGIFALAASMTWLAFAQAPWELYAAYLLLACAWMGMGTVVIATLVSSRFARRRGLALSIAFNGATCGGIIVAPALVFLVERIGFTKAMLTMTVVMLVVLVPAVGGLVGLSAPRRSAGNEPIAPTLSRGKLLGNLAFWTITAPFALALLAQVGFIVHQIALLEPKIGRANAGFAVSVMTFMAIAGRLGLGMVVDRFDPRRVTAVSVVSQAAALLMILHFDTVPVVLTACALFGFSVGNLITLPPLIMHREFSSASFVVVMGLSNAISGTIGSLGPAFIGLVRSWSGGYDTALVLCIALQLIAAVIVVRRGSGKPVEGRK